MIIHQVTSLHSLSTASMQEPGSWSHGRNGGSAHSRLLAISMKQHTRVWCPL